MSDVVIRVDNLGKQYRLGKRQRYNSLRESLVDTLKHPLRRIRARGNIQTDAPDTFWALKDVSFEVKQGEVVGIIGHNGAGKSTLLKILSRITEPTAGQVELTGRVGSLLEVGTGFHPELTGRENVYLNGAILGMRREEIARKFDEIVAFAEVEKFIDTPVKHYSSGMYMRLAFSVAAHLDPELLLVDEVLAVGDVGFQKKCLRRIGEVAHAGRTVLFVSHNMMAVQKICHKALLLEVGKVRCYDDDVPEVIRTCLSNGTLDQSEWVNPGSLFANPYFKPLRLRLTDHLGNQLRPPIPNNMSMYLEVEGEIQLLDPSLILNYSLYRDDGELMFISGSKDLAEEHWPNLRKGRNVVRGRIPSRVLNEGIYQLELLIGLYSNKEVIPFGTGPSLSLRISGGISDSPIYNTRRPGILAPIADWETVG